MECVGKEYQKKAGIYKIINRINQKIYIGSSCDLYRRCRKHACDLKRNKHSNSHLQSSYNKHGRESFQFIIIELVNNQEMLLEREQYWIDYSDCCQAHIGYNQAPIAGNTLGFKHSEESRRKNSLSKRGLFASISIEKASDAKKLLNEGKLVRQIADELEIPYEVVSSIKKGKAFSYVEPKLLPECLHPKAKLGEDAVINIKKLLRLGVKVKEIAEEFEVNYRTISLIKNNGIWKEVGGEVNVRRRRKVLSKEQVAEIKRYILDGETNKEIAEKMNILRSTVSDIRRGHSWKN